MLSFGQFGRSRSRVFTDLVQPVLADGQHAPDQLVALTEALSNSTVPCCRRGLKDGVGSFSRNTEVRLYQTFATTRSFPSQHRLSIAGTLHNVSQTGVVCDNPLMTTATQ